MMMKTTKILALGTAMVALTLPVSYVQAATDALGVEANILASPLAVDATQNLNFGAFTNNGAGGTVEVDTAGSGTYTGVTQILGPVETEGRVVMTGNAAQPIDIRVVEPGPIIVSHSTAAGVTMEVTNFDINGLGKTGTITMTGTTMAVPIGAELTVPAAKPPGAYTGTFTVETLYQ
jgi:hypothetical protein